MNLNLIKNDFQILHDYLFTNESDLNTFKNNLEVFYNKHFNIQSTQMEISYSVSEHSSSLTNLSRDETKKMVEEKLRSNFKRKSKTYTLREPETIHDYLNLIKNLNEKIKHYENKCLNIYFLIGKYLISLKEMDKKNFKKSLKNHGINYSVSYINTIIRFANLAKKHSSILDYTLSFYFINKYFTIIEEIFMKNQS